MVHLWASVPLLKWKNRTLQDRSVSLLLVNVTRSSKGWDRTFSSQFSVASGILHVLFLLLGISLIPSLPTSFCSAWQTPSYSQRQLILPSALVGVLLLCAAILPVLSTSPCVAVCFLVFLDPVVSVQRAETVCSHHWIPSWMVRFLECGKC